ncbi:nucleoside-diphosphate-sugar epimerase [Tenacibaculum adriaticum]|uniref:Nucleoside-diphosphate-sugar epimerase n=1 Tax=Tenacibaculum adriaticum TaxID=413713 RepID=A0A5S5DVW2_9FLAO|nr:SDR family oxidoreductase [Tenacibaculum adriaticum]TYP99975.1 nucleoside-diphosphate-sugar epimerase [Tenacibaculum adriaticum]
MILVTGGTGLVGSHLLYHLIRENNVVRATYRSEDKLEKVKTVFSFYTGNSLSFFKKIEWIRADINDTPSLKAVFEGEITYVYHCAALVSFNPEDYRKMRKVNIEGTANVINFSIDKKIKKFCHVSSIAAIGDSINGNLTTEENEWNDQSENHGYSITKYGAEMEVWRASQEGIDIVIVNPGVILGAGFFNEGSGKFFTQVYNGFKFFTEGVTGFVGVKDVVKVMINLMNSNIKNERFILVSENKSFKEIFFTIADVFNKKRPSIKIGKFATSLLWKIDWFLTTITRKQPLLTKNSARSSQRKEYYSSEKIKKELGYEFEPIDTVIKEICNNYSG